MRLLRRNGPLPRMHRVERGVSRRPSCACDMAPSAAHLHALLSLLALLLMSCHQGAQQRACERVGVALVECSCVCRCEGAMRVCPNWDQRSPCSIRLQTLEIRCERTRMDACLSCRRAVPAEPSSVPRRLQHRTASPTCRRGIQNLSCVHSDAVP